MHKNRQVLKNRTSTAVPAAPAPFIPSAVPGTDLHWRKAASRKAKESSLFRSASVDKSSNRRIKNRTSEYEEKFVEWEMPHRDEVPSDRQYAPTGFYERDANAFDWKSEQQRTYTKKDMNLRDVRTAGVPRASRSEAPTFYVEDESLNQYNEGKEDAAAQILL